MDKNPSVSSREELRSLEERIELAAKRTVANLQALVESREPIDVLRSMKFDECGSDPLKASPLNLIEQLNQTFTYLASLKGVAYLLETHPDSAPFVLNLGTRPGHDIESMDGEVVCEVFAAVRPGNNDKLNKDSKRVHGAKAKHKYVFFLSPGVEPGEQSSSFDDVRVISVD